MKFFSLLLIFFLSLTAVGQQTKDDAYKLSPEEVEAYKAQTRALVSYFEGTLNFLGDASATTQEKEIVINESWSKIFVNSEVQVEDDLDEQREVPINKDVQAYLKDVDFFFRSAVFAFDIQSVEPMVGENGNMYFKVTFMRRLNAISLNNDTLQSAKLRYMEVNLDPFKKDLKIASYYTTRINEQDELRQWWTSVPPYWKAILGRDAVVFDTLLMADIEGVVNEKILVKKRIPVVRKGTFLVAGNDTLPESEAARLFNRRPDTIIQLNDVQLQWVTDSLDVNLSVIDNKLKQIVSTTSLDLAYKVEVVDLEPLSQLSELIDLNISNTSVNDLSPLRNLSKLESLYLSSTLVNDLSPLQYASNLREIYFHDTEIENITTLGHLRKLEKLYCFNTGVRSLAALAQLQQLVVLKAGNTQIENIEPLSGLVNMRMLDLSQTLITSVDALENLEKLQQLILDQTLVSDLQPLHKMQDLSLLQVSGTRVHDLSVLKDLKNLSRVYADGNDLVPGQATSMMLQKPGLLIIFDSQELRNWWNNLPIYWRALLTAQSGTPAQPTDEDLHQITSLQKLDLSGNAYLQQLDPLSRLVNLQELSIQKTEVTDLKPLKELHNLRKLNLSETRVSELDHLSGLFQLEELNIENTRVASLEPLFELKNLSLLLADKSRVASAEAMKLKYANPQVRLVYQTETLLFWWNNQSTLWQELLAQDLTLEATPNALQLQSIADRTTLVIENRLEVSGLEPLMPLLMLEKLVIKSSSVTDLHPLEVLTQLRWLELSGNPLSDLSPLAKLQKLTYLSLENTPVSDLTVLANLTQLEQLNVGGTQVKSLKATANLKQLTELSVYNTRLKSLSPADKLPALKHLRCYNTRISKKSIDKLKAVRPELNVLYY